MKGSTWFVLILMVIGGCLVYYGFLENRLSGDASPEPVGVSLADLEAGKPLPDAHIRIGLHHRMYAISVYEYEDDGGGLKSDTPIYWTYYPIISDEHPYAKGVNDLRAKFGSLDNVPKGTPWPALGEVAIVVKTEVFSTYGEIPRSRKYTEGIEGMVINEIESLGEEEEKLLSEGFPKMDFSKILILEEYRRPVSTGAVVAIISIGSLLILLPGFLLLRSRLHQAA